MPNHLQGGFGLVWDGDSPHTCSGMYGEYLKMNNPHKSSLYLASGFPIIVWSQSALADFVRKNNCGILVDSLFEIAERLDSISNDEYEVLLKNSKKIGDNIRKGYYLKTALEKCERRLLIMKLQLVKEKLIRYNQILRYYGPKLTLAYYFQQQTDSKYYDFSDKVILDFVQKLRKQGQIDDSSSEKKEVTIEFPNIIWTMWQQGEAQMPETVKSSMKTIKDFARRNGCELHLLTDENLHNFINIPKDITEKYKKKELSAAHYSDIVRFSLLYQYGGIWMDATLFVSPYATLEMFEGDFFSFNHPPIHSDKMERYINDYKWSSFCLAGKKGRSYFKHVRDLFIYFVRKYPIFINYFMLDYFILSEYTSNPEFRLLVNKLPVLEPAERMYFLREHANDVFDENEWEEVLKTTPIMKTTYKINKDTLIPGSYLYKLFHGELNE